MKRLRSGMLAGFIAVLMTLTTLLVAAADTPPSVLPAPTNLSMSSPAGDRSIAAGTWINTRKIDLHFQVPATTGQLTPQVEMVPASDPFTDTPTATGTPLSVAGAATVTATGLQDRQTYHWEARVADGKGNTSDWVAFGGLAANSHDVGIDRDAPSRPVITSPTDPDQNRRYNTTVEILHWGSRDTTSGVAGYSFLLERHPHVIPPGAISPQTSARISHLGDGSWYMALRSVDRAGNWSPTATFRLQLDHQVPQLTWLSPSKFTFNPYRGPATVRFRINEDASARLSLYRVGAARPAALFSFPLLRAGQVTSLTWSGKTARGHVVRRGYYFFSASVVDDANNLDRVNVGGIVVNPLQARPSPAGPIVFPDGGKRIIVSLSRETLYAYDGDKLALQTLVTTGNPNLPTPTGHYTVLEKIHPFEFVSPWPLGSPYYYAPSWVQYAMLFRDGGYFLHDAPWRGAFGPGTDGPGQPGTNYGGTHGCVNIPPTPMQFLWDWTSVGTAVDVVS